MSTSIHKELEPIKENKRKHKYIPPTFYTLSTREKYVLCYCLKGVKVPNSYSYNIRSFVSLEDCKLYDLKSHDFYTLMQHLLPIAIRFILPMHVRFFYHPFMSLLQFYIKNICID